MKSKSTKRKNTKTPVKNPMAERMWQWEELPSMLDAGGIIPIVPGRQRTSYFYRQMAIKCRQNLLRSWSQEMRDTWRWLALNYLGHYKKLKGVAA